VLLVRKNILQAASKAFSIAIVENGKFFERILPNNLAGIPVASALNQQLKIKN
jgi:orotate phosphoribosyltransferase